MRDSQTQILQALAERTKYPFAAFQFVTRGMRLATKHARQELGFNNLSEPVQVSAQQLCRCLLDLAIKYFGCEARAVLRSWRIDSCEDFGKVVFAMAEAGLLRKSEAGSLADFAGVFSFEEVFAEKSWLCSHCNIRYHQQVMACLVCGSPNPALQVLAEGTNYPLPAFEFVARTLSVANSRVIRDSGITHPKQPVHVTGQELCRCLRDQAIKYFDNRAREVLHSWRIDSCEDFGKIVYAMVEAGLMGKSETDSIADFAGVFSFDDAFGEMSWQCPRCNAPNQEQVATCVSCGNPRTQTIEIRDGEASFSEVAPEPRKRTKRKRPPFQIELSTLLLLVGCCAVLIWFTKDVWKGWQIRRYHDLAAAQKKLGDSEVSALVRELQSGKLASRRMAAQTLALMKADAAPAVPYLIEALNDAEIHEQAAQALLAVGPTALPAMVEALRGSDEVTRGNVAHALENVVVHDAKAAIPLLVEALEDDNLQVRALTVRLLGEAGPSAAPAVEALVNACADMDVRPHALVALGDIGVDSPNVVSALAEALREPDEDLRRTAVIALGRLARRSQDVQPILLEAIDDENASVRTMTIQTLASLGAKAQFATPRLIAALKDSAPRVRIEAARALSLIGQAEKDAVAALQDLLLDQDHFVRREAAEAIEQIARDRQARRLKERLHL